MVLWPKGHQGQCCRSRMQRLSTRATSVARVEIICNIKKDDGLCATSSNNQRLHVGHA